MKGSPTSTRVLYFSYTCLRRYTMTGLPPIALFVLVVYLLQRKYSLCFNLFSLFLLSLFIQLIILILIINSQLMLIIAQWLSDSHRSFTCTIGVWPLGNFVFHILVYLAYNHLIILLIITYYYTIKCYSTYFWRFRPFLGFWLALKVFSRRVGKFYSVPQTDTSWCLHYMVTRSPDC